MAITPGTVTVDDEGEVTTGAHPAGRLFALLLAKATTDAAAFDAPAPEGPDGAKTLQALAGLANLQAEWLCAEFDLLRAAVGTSLSGVQRMPSSTSENTDTKAPSAEKLLPLKYAP